MFAPQNWKLSNGSNLWVTLLLLCTHLLPNNSTSFMGRIASSLQVTALYTSEPGMARGKAYTNQYLHPTILCLTMGRNCMRKLTDNHGWSSASCTVNLFLKCTNTAKGFQGTLSWRWTWASRPFLVNQHFNRFCVHCMNLHKALHACANAKVTIESCMCSQAGSHSFDRVYRTRAEPHPDLANPRNGRLSPKSLVPNAASGEKSGNCFLGSLSSVPLSCVQS